jgi:Fic family protein
LVGGCRRSGHILAPIAKGLARINTRMGSICERQEKGIDLSLKIACSAFGFVYLHPFMDGNGRLHRFMNDTKNEESTFKSAPNKIGR